MKKEVMLIIFSLFLILFLLSIASATYVCSNNTEISKDSKEIKELERKSVNGLGIAVINAEEHSVLKRITTEIILEAEIISLTNETRTEEVEFSDGTYTVKMVNATDISAKIKIGSQEKEINEGEYTTLGGLEVILSKAEESSGGSAELIAGNNKISLSNDENPTETLTIGSMNYLIEIFSATDTDAIITVWRCKNGEVLILEEQTEENVTEENATEQIENEIIKEDIEENISAENKTEEKSEEINGKTEESILRKTWFWFSLALIIIMIGYIIYKRTI